MDETLYNIEAEQGLLGILLYDNRALEIVFSKLKPESFHEPAHALIYKTITDIIGAGGVASAVTLHGKLGEAVPRDYLVSLLSSFAAPSNVRHYAEVIHDLSLRRSLVRVADEIKGMALDQTQSNILSGADKLLTDLSDDRGAAEYSAAEAVQVALEWCDGIASGKIKPISTGFESIDKKIGGLFSGRLYIIAARPGMGKTAFALNIADAVSTETPSLFISLEMPAQELGMRLMAARTGITIQRQQNPRHLSREDWDAMTAAKNDIGARQLKIVDASGIDLARIKMLARQYRRKNGKFVLFLDYLGLISMDKRIASKVHQIEDITTNLKSLAKELDIPVVLLSQLSRALENREDKTPSRRICRPAINL